MRFLALIFAVLLRPTAAFNPIAAASSLIRGPASKSPSLGAEATLEEETENLPVNRVAVIGATGRTGKYVVQELLDRGADEVVAVVRSASKAKETFGEESSLKFVECDLTDPTSIASALKDMEAAIWCATGFSSESGMIDRLKSLMGIVTKKSIDLVGLPVVAETIQSNTIGKGDSDLPKVVMCSSAGVTRPTWDEEKKDLLKGSAEIPIVRLNPFGILDIKRESEEKLRQTGVPYCIVRPAGLNDKWPAGSRPILSQGDVAVGRINRKDVATLLVDILSEPAATGKTMEVIGLCNYPKALSITTSLEQLSLDSDGELPLEKVVSNYQILQQLLPGEKQDSAALAMGQTYEQLDKDEVGRLGERGTENAEAAGLKPTNT